MKLKLRLKYAIGEIGNIPWVARVAGVPSLRRVLQRIPGVRCLYHRGWDRLHPFDRVNGIEASSAAGFEPQLAGQPALKHANIYAGSQPGVTRAALAMLPRLETSTFVDLGCGKGRPVCLATEFPFRDIVGVEFSPRLADLARENADIMARRYPQRTRVRIETGDAGAFAFPSGDIVLFLFHPFGEEIMRKVVANLEKAMAAEQRSVYVVYYTPVYVNCFNDSPFFTHIFTRIFPYDREEHGFGYDGELEATISLWRGGTAPPITQEEAGGSGRRQ